jgi:hypothetical protein
MCFYVSTTFSRHIYLCFCNILFSLFDHLRHIFRLSYILLLYTQIIVIQYGHTMWRYVILYSLYNKEGEIFLHNQGILKSVREIKPLVSMVTFEFQQYTICIDKTHGLKCPACVLSIPRSTHRPIIL